MRLDFRNESFETREKYEKQFEFEYKGKQYCLMELMVPGSNVTYDIIAVFEERHSEECPDYTDFRFINYFYGASDETEKLIECAKSYIDDEEGE